MSTMRGGQIPIKTCEGLMSLLCMDADFDICIEISACAVQDILRLSVSTAAKIQIKSNLRA